MKEAINDACKLISTALNYVDSIKSKSDCFNLSEEKNISDILSEALEILTKEIQ